MILLHLRGKELKEKLKELMKIRKGEIKEEKKRNMSVIKIINCTMKRLKNINHLVITKEYTIIT